MFANSLTGHPLSIARSEENKLTALHHAFDSAINILIIEDDAALSKLLTYSIQKLGYDIMSVSTAEEGLLAFNKEPVDLILLDVMLPGMNGVEFCGVIRQFSSVPIIVLSSLNDPNDIVDMLEVGADEYIVKPCNFSFVEAMIIAQLRRDFWNNRTLDMDTPLKAGPIILDVANQIAMLNEMEVRLSQRECSMLAVLIKQPEKPIPTSKLYEEVWGECNGQEKTMVPTLIQRLRTKIEKDPARPSFIINVRGYGYKLTLYTQGLESS